MSGGGQIILPTVIASDGGAVLTKWHIKAGDDVRPGDILAEIRTDVRVVEIEATDHGLITNLYVAEGSGPLEPGHVIAGVWRLPAGAAEAGAVARVGRMRPLTGTETVRPAAKQQNRGGAPMRYDWEGALAFAAIFVHENGIPVRSSGELNRAILGWFADRGEHPSEAEVRKRVSLIYAEAARAKVSAG